MDQEEILGIRLSKSIDLNDFVKDNFEGVEFEIDQNFVNFKSENETSNQIYVKDFETLKYFKSFEWPDENDPNYVDLTGDNGVKKQIIREGVGPLIPQNAKVSVHYSLFGESNDEPFDSTRLRENVFHLRLGHGMVIPAFEYMLPSMKKGELSLYLIQPKYAFHEMGCPPRIPPNVVVLCEMEVIKFSTECNFLNDYDFFTEAELNNITLNEVLEVVCKKRLIGNHYVKSGKFLQALPIYKKAVKLLENYHNKNEEEEAKINKTLIPIYLNLALTCLKLCHSKSAIRYCNLVRLISDKNVKALFRMGQALMQLSEFDRAESFILEAHSIRPNDVEIIAELKKLKEKRENFTITEKTMCSKMFSKHFSKNETAEINQSENENMQFSTEFKKTVKKRLEDFKNDPDLVEIPFPSNMNASEVAYIITIAESKGLAVSYTNIYSNMKIFKKKPFSD